MDTTGQIGPSGRISKASRMMWEDEGTWCFQVEANGRCVARREDNGMINGSRLLDVAGVTRGRRDGILKAEKQRHVIEIAPMHL
ncbi:asm-1, partial [Ascobolus immersus RN42]